MTAAEASTLIHMPDMPGNGTPQSWADLGSGSGLFTRTLLTQLPRGSTVYAIDRDEVPAPSAGIVSRQADFTAHNWQTPPLHGILMANSLHFVKDHKAFLQKAVDPLLPAARFLFVEYDTDKPNPWVPYPLSFKTLQQLFRSLQLGEARLLHTMPSRFGGAQLYSAMVTLR